MLNKRKVYVEGCGAAPGGRGECRGCGGRHRYTSERLTHMVTNNRVPVGMCGPLSERVARARFEMKPLFMQTAIRGWRVAKRRAMLRIAQMPH